MYRFLSVLLLVPLLNAHAALQPMDDEELGDQVGQAFIQFDRTENVGGLDFTKITFGLNVETSLNADLVDLGNYSRNGQAGSDIRINDFALGSVNDDGSINPFNITDPFLEVAFDEDQSGRQNVVGVRFGFSGAQGSLSGNIESLTGNIEVDVVGSASPIYDEANFFQQGLLFLAGVSRNTRLRADAVLVDGSGNPTNVRASSVGVANGETLQCESGCNLGRLSDFLLGLFGSNNCAVLGLSTCFDLGNFNTLQIGSDNAPAEGLFVSFQSQPITWIDGNTSTRTVSGAYVNIPNGGIVVDFEQSFNGIPRVRTKLLDPYFD
ncbi:hypothetical protein [Bacterioplanoides sp.]|uniref:hypothetical protein n=1 Tax=Bacterioplanoides sp. TaxID=2066072 RepID=UPI003AFF890B